MEFSKLRNQLKITKLVSGRVKMQKLNFQAQGEWLEPLLELDLVKP